MPYNKESGYGKHTQSYPFLGGGQVFVVARSAAAGRQIMQDSFRGFDGVARYFATVDAAINATTASRGDTIYVAPNHAETFTAAAGFALDVAGVSVIGLGVGNNRPVFTISSTDNTGSITMAGNNTKLHNIVIVCNDDALTNALNVTGNNCDIDIELQDTSAAIEAATAVRLDTADNCKLKLKYLGFAAGNATVSAIRLDDCDNVDIEVDYYGVLTTAVVEMVDVASSNVKVKGNFYVSGITTLARNVVDTITGSTWWVEGFDGAAGAAFSGGSGNAIAVGDLSVIASSIGGVADAALADTIEGAAASTQSLLTDVKGVLQRLGADNANNTSATTLVAANRDGSVLERLEDLRQNEGFSAGLVYQGTCDAGMAGSTTAIVSADLAGRGNDFYNTKYYMMVLLNVNSAGNAPEMEVRQITDYVSATGTFTCTAFSVNVEASDSILVMHESLVLLGRDDGNNTMATTNVVANVDGSVLERLEDIVVKVTAVDDLIDTEIGVIDGFHDVPLADAAGNTQMRDVIGNKTDTNAGTSLLARHLVQTADAVTNANMRDVVGNKADAAAAGDVSATESLMAYVKQAITELSGTAGITTFPAAAAPANGVALADVLREVYDQEEKVATNAAAILSNATTVFTIAGGPIEILSLVARCVSGNDATASTLQWDVDPTDGAAVTITAASASLANALAGALLIFQGTSLATAPTLNASGAGLGQTVTNGVIVGAGILRTVIGVGSTTGTWMHHLRYRPLARGVTVTGSV